MIDPVPRGQEWQAGHASSHQIRAAEKPVRSFYFNGAVYDTSKVPKIRLTAYIMLCTGSEENQPFYQPICLWWRTDLGGDYDHTFTSI